jgi:peptidoglycan hydrolase-like protein with peptidoglycan-binding domain
MHFEFVDNGGRKPKSDPPIYPPVAQSFFDASADTAAPADELEDAPQPAAATTPTGYSLDVEILQRKLDRLGYHEVGEIDGRMGGKTKGVITAFMNDRGQKSDGSLTPDVTREVGEALAEGWSRPIADQRANATAKDIAPKVEAVRQTLWQRFWAKVTAGGAALGLTGSSLSGYFDSVKEKLGWARSSLSNIPPEVWFLIIGAVALLVWYSANRATQATVRDYNTGRLN